MLDNGDAWKDKEGERKDATEGETSRKQKHKRIDRGKKSRM